MGAMKDLATTLGVDYTPISFPFVPLEWKDECRYCLRYRRPCGRHDEHVNLIRYPRPNILGLGRH